MARKFRSISSVPRSKPSAAAYRRSTAPFRNALGLVLEFGADRSQFIDGGVRRFECLFELVGRVTLFLLEAFG